MRVKKGFTAIVLIAAALLLVPTFSFAIDFTQEEIYKLEAGKTIKKPLSNSRQNGFYGGTGWTVVDAPIDAVWEALKDLGAYSTIFPRTLGAKEVARKGEQSLVRMELGYKILSVEYYLNIVEDKENYKISFELVSTKPHDIENTRGYWRLFLQPNGRTLVAYAVTVQIPSGMVVFLGKSMEKSLEGCLIGLPRYLKKWVESPAGNRYRTMTASK